MILNKYRYLFCDASYYLKKSVFIAWNNWIKSGKTESFTEADIARMTMYSINKAMKEMNGADKPFLVWDQWASDIKGYYTTYILNSKYKDNREWVSKEDAESAEVSEEEKQKLLDKAAMFDMQVKSKRWIIANLGQFGIPSIRYYGYEHDQLVYVYSSLLAGDDKRSTMASSDSDIRYLVNPNVDLYKIGVRGAESILVTYEEMIKEMPEELLGKVSLYDWKAYYDSIEGSHNAMRRSRRDRFNTKVIIQNIIERGDYSGIEDMELFKLQYSTFKIDEFPKFQSIVNEFPEKLRLGSIASLEKFKEFNEENKLGISDSWYNRFTEKLDTKLYEN